MSDLTDFLLAMIARDEDVARDALASLKEHAAAFYDEDEPPGDWRQSWEGFGRSAWSEGESRPISRHIARHDPARVLAECEAKRRVVEVLESLSWTGSSSRSGRALRALAAVHSDHPDYRPEWRP